MGWTDDKAVGAEHDLRGRVLAVLSALPEGRCMDEQQVSAAVGGGRVGLVLQRLASERLVAPTLTGWHTGPGLPPPTSMQRWLPTEGAVNCAALLGGAQ